MKFKYSKDENYYLDNYFVQLLMHATTHDKKLGMIIRYILKKLFGISSLNEKR